MDTQSITHTRWNCTYHIVFIPKFRRKIMYGETKKDLVEIIKKLCEMKQVQLIDGKVCVDHVHMYVAIPPKGINYSDEILTERKKKLHTHNIEELYKTACDNKDIDKRIPSYFDNIEDIISFYYFDEEGYAGIYN